MTFQVNAQQHFTSIDHQGCAPFGVELTTNNAVSGSSYLWEIEGPTNLLLTSESPTFVSILTEPGNYSVKLYENSILIETVPDYILVFEPPVAAFTQDQLSSCLPTCVNFSSTSTSAVNISSYQWDMGDGSVYNSPNPQHCYTNPGTYSPILNIVDSHGCFSYVQNIGAVVVNANQSTAQLHIEDEINCAENFHVEFGNNSTGNFTSATWDFGDGTSEETIASVVSHHYSNEGNYNVCLTTTDFNGCVSQECENITVYFEPQSSINLSQVNACVNQEVLLALQTTTPVQQINWNYNNTEYSTSETNFTLVPTSTGNSLLFAIITYANGCVQQIDGPNISVHANPSVQITAPQMTSCDAPFTPQITFVSSPDVNSYSWAVNGTPVSTVPTLNYGFQESGYHDVSLTVINQFGCSATSMVNDLIWINNPIISFTHDTQGCVGNDIRVTDLDIDNSTSIISYTWTSTGTDQIFTTSELPEFNYTIPGTYQITLTVETSSGCTAIHTSPQIITIVETLPTTFSIDEDDFCAARALTLCIPEDNLYRYSWKMGDNPGWTNLPNTGTCVQYTYSDTGTFNLIERVRYGRCTVYDTLYDILHVSGPIAKFNYNVLCEDHLTVTGYDASIAATSLTWDFGDNSALIYDETYVEHTYANFGEYQIALTASDGNTACDYTEIHTVLLQLPDPSLSVSDISGCAPLELSINTNSYNIYWEISISNGAHLIADSNGGTDTWSIQYTDEEGVTAEYELDEGESFIPNQNLLYADCYDLDVFVYDIHNCPAEIHYEDLVCVLSNHDFAEFDYTVLSDCAPFELQFTPEANNLSTTEWSFGNGATSLEHSPSHVFGPEINHDEGLYITLDAVDNLGCTSSYTLHPDVALPTFPSFETSTEVTCQEQAVVFTNTSLGPIASAEWTFGDNSSESNTSNETNGSHMYTQNGVYAVCLTVTSPSGCVQTYCDNQAVIIENPVVTFNYSAAMNNCLNGVQFESTSAGNIAQLYWDFGDGQSGLGTTAFHSYPIGVYEVTLIATGVNGCVDSLTVTDVLNYGNEIGPFSFTLDTLDCAPFEATFAAYDPTDNYFTYFWDFNDGQGIPEGTAQVTHEYLSGGTYCPQLIMTDPNGCQVFIPCSSSISVTDLIVGHNIPASMCANDSLTIILENAESYSWSDNTAITPGNAYNEFVLVANQSNSYFLTSMVGDCTTIDTLNLLVHSIPEVSLVLPDHICQNQQTYPANGGSPVGGNYYLNTELITEIQSEDEVNIYQHYRYVFTDEHGCSDTAYDSVYVRALPSFSIGENPVHCAEETAFNLNLVQPAGGVYLYDGTEITSIDPQESVGISEIDYTFVDTFGCFNDTNITVHVAAMPVVSFSHDVLCGESMASFQNTSSTDESMIVETTWRIDNNTVGADFELNYQLPSTGNIPLQLEVSSEYGCSSTIDTVLAILPKPQAAITAPDACAMDNVTIYASGEENMTYTWIIEENIVGHSDTLQYAFMNYGTPEIQLEVENAFGCRDTATTQVSIFPVPEIQLATIPVCDGDEVTVMNNTTVAYGALEQHQWFFDGEAVEAQMGELFATALEGVHQVIFEVYTELGCRAIDSIMAEIKTSPVAEFILDNNDICPGDMVNALDASHYEDNAQTITQWQWQLDGVFSSNSQHPTFLLGGPASYDVRLIVTGENGCTDDTLLNNAIIVRPQPVAGFAVTEPEVNMSAPFIEITNASSADVVGWHYDFGDGMASNMAEGVHEYAHWESYYILQTVTNTFGCVDTVGQTVMVNPQLLVHIPNAFSPDGNGHNDIYLPILHGTEILDFSFDVYDRWGRVMFSSDSALVGWDGTIRETGDFAPCGVYNWKLRYRTIDQPLIKQSTGSVTLIR
ncbi:MAG: PKD domain-containing protein [Flavobacteriales bacterium]